ncbi:hypothetical protein HYR99_24465 [Candidatus Poribacteria bacterium]|nr:hypothetical protein [Candidatus Poribacteria bacterium]
MRKYLILIGLLTLTVVLPFVYQEWSEANRLKRIHKVRAEAQKMDGVSMTDLLAHIEQPSQGKQLFILFTGNTQGNLEPCGCFVGQSGGIARRATVIKTLRQKGVPFLLVDAGGIVEGNTPLDRLRTAVYLEAMAQMGYDVVCLSQRELEGLEREIPPSPLFKGGTEGGFRPDRSGSCFARDFAQLVSANLKQTVPTAQPFLNREVGGVKVTLIGLSELSNPEAPTETFLQQYVQGGERGVTILLSNLSIETNRTMAQQFPQIDAILGSAEGEMERVGDTLIVYAQPKGKTLSLLTLKLSESDQVTESAVQEILLQEDVPDDPQVREGLTRFYQQVAATPEFQHAKKALFTEMPLEQNPNNRYVGSSECASCHTEEHTQWQSTSHAAAFNTLLNRQRHFYPDCIRCHTTGFGYPTGYQIGQIGKTGGNLSEVGCETCHGPGRAHTLNPIKANIRGKVTVNVCAECHTPEHAPGFLEMANLLMKEVDHSEKQIDLETLIRRRLRGPMKPDVELFVMSYCPFGTGAEKNLLPWLRNKFGDGVNVTLRFIASEKTSGDPAKADSSPPTAEIERSVGTLEFTSLHGQVEVVEDIRQVVIATYYPEKLMNYVLCRADSLKKSWQICAQNVGLDVEKIQRIVESDEGKQLFLENIRRSKALNINASPTLVVDGVTVDSKLLRKTAKGVCSAF